MTPAVVERTFIQLALGTTFASLVFDLLMALRMRCPCILASGGHPIRLRWLEELRTVRPYLVVGFLAATSCAHVDVSRARLESQKEFGIIVMGEQIAYLVDPRTESCLLVYANTAAAQVDCAKLKASVPEAAKYITWNPTPAAP